MLDQKQGDAGVGEAAQNAAEQHLVGSHQTGGWLIEQQYVGAGGERARNLDQPTINVREFAGGRAKWSLVADQSQQSLRVLARRAARGRDQWAAQPASALRQ